MSNLELAGTMSSTIWPATERFGLAPAPGGLGLVQDIINTAAYGRPREPDLLANLDSAQAWINQTLARWAAAVDREPVEIVLQQGDQDALRDLRSDVFRAVAGAEFDASRNSRSGSLAARLRNDGQVEVEPRGERARHFASAVLLECFLAQRLDTWRRLKTCKNERCQVAFYDRSRNNGGVWHDVKVCGNAANLRASRARRRAAVGEA
jgi:predicted RNA-binding Zn ribbon-like protein